MLGGIAVVKGAALLNRASPWSVSLYLPFERVPAPEQTTFTAIPYYANANRGPVDMLVWIPETAGRWSRPAGLQ
jgi:DUF1680 family protein